VTTHFVIYYKNYYYSVVYEKIGKYLKVSKDYHDIIALLNNKSVLEIFLFKLKLNFNFS